MSVFSLKAAMLMSIEQAQISLTKAIPMSKAKFFMM